MEAFHRLFSGEDDHIPFLLIRRHLQPRFLLQSQTDKKGKLIEDMLFEEGCYRAQGTMENAFLLTMRVYNCFPRWSLPPHLTSTHRVTPIVAVISLLGGTLLARPGSNQPSIENVEITFSTYAIDFGKSLHDAGRGYWVKGILDNGSLLTSFPFYSYSILSLIP